MHTMESDDDLPVIRPRLRRTAHDVDSHSYLYMNISSDGASNFDEAEHFIWVAYMFTFLACVLD